MPKRRIFAEIASKSAAQTKKIAGILAKEILVARRNSAAIIALEGNLGAGKTTFAQGFADALGIKEKVLSPTFVLLKIYKTRKSKRAHLAHIDCYRIGSPRELPGLGLKEISKDKDAIILIEWADRIRKLLPRDTIWIRFLYGRNIHERVLQFKTESEKRKTAVQN